MIASQAQKGTDWQSPFKKGIQVIQIYHVPPKKTELPRMTNALYSFEEVTKGVNEENAFNIAYMDFSKSFDNSLKAGWSKGITHKTSIDRHLNRQVQVGL